MSEAPENTQGPDSPDGMKIDLGKETVEFGSNRANLVIEIGSGGVTTVIYPAIKKHLEESDANYLGIDPDYHATEVLKYFGRDVAWARGVGMGYGEIPEQVHEIADQVWIRNFLFNSVHPTQEAAQSLFKAVRRLLKENGELTFMDNYSRYSETERALLRGALEEVGFEVEDIKLNNDEHPFIASYRKADLSTEPNNIYGGSAIGLRGKKKA